MKKLIFVILICFICFVSIFYLVLFTSPPVVLFDVLEPAISNQKQWIENEMVFLKGTIVLSKKIKTDFLLRYPNNKDKKNLCLIMSGYIHGKEAVYHLDDEMIIKKNIAMLAFDYYSNWPDEKGSLSKLLYLKEFEKDIRANMRLCFALLKEILKRDDIKEEGNLYVGASLGSFICTYPVSRLKENFSHVALVYSGSDLSTLIGKLLTKNISVPMLTPIIGKYFENRLYFADPAFSAISFSRKKVLLVNGTDDASIPKESQQALFNAFPHAEKVILKGKHLSTQREDLLQNTLTHIDEFY